MSNHESNSENGSGERKYRIAERVSNADVLQGEAVAWKFSREQLRKHPYRDPDQLAAVISDAKSLKDAAKQLQTRRGTLKRWLDAFGVDYRTQFSSRAEWVRDNVSPEDLGMDPMPDSEGSA
jgi:hypothetical protein